MLDIVVAVILGAALVTFFCVAAKTQDSKKGPKRDSKGRFTK